MTKKQKIDALLAVAAGKLDKGDLKQETFLFIGFADNWECDGKKYTDSMFSAFCKRIDRVNRRRAIYGLPENQLIVIEEQS